MDVIVLTWTFFRSILNQIEMKNSFISMMTLGMPDKNDQERRVTDVWNHGMRKSCLSSFIDLNDAHTNTARFEWKPTNN